MRKAFFLDRDGTINVEVDYLHRCEDMQLIPGVVESIRAIHEAGFLALVVSNQAGVARGMYTLDDVRILEKFMCEKMAEIDPAGVPDAFYYCPHHLAKGIIPEYTIACECRKPRPGMLLRAKEEWDLDLSQCFMIGDRLGDVEAGINAACRESVFVKTGHGMEEIAEAQARNYVIYEDMAQAVKNLLQK